MTSRDYLYTGHNPTKEQTMQTVDPGVSPPDRVSRLEAALASMLDDVSPCWTAPDEPHHCAEHSAYLPCYVAEARALLAEAGQ